MKPILAALIREDKIPTDRRVAFLPEQLNQIIADYPHVNFVVQSSQVRSVADSDYIAAGFQVLDDVSHADVLFGIKEVPKEKLIANKTYLFFSHTIKQQPYNRALLQTVLKKNITLLDYEVFTDEDGARTVAFGQYAGIVGAYNGIRAYGLRNKTFEIRPAFECEHLAKMKQEFTKVVLPPIKIAITGTGRVARGAQEVLDMLGIEQVSIEQYLDSSPINSPVYCMLRSRDYNMHKENKAWNNEDFHKNPHLYKSTFLPFAQKTDMLIACAYWHPSAPRLFEISDMQKADFKIKVIADVTCDIDGSIPSTLRPSTIQDPFYDFNTDTQEIVPAFSNENHISVMAVDNLPCELPRDASFDFGTQIMHSVLPSLFGKENKGILDRATIAHNGSLTKPFLYLQEYIDKVPLSVQV